MSSFTMQDLSESGVLTWQNSELVSALSANAVHKVCVEHACTGLL